MKFKIRISIITAAPHVRNYGSVLLTYATKKLFEAHDFHVEFIDYSRRTLEEAENFSDVKYAIGQRDIFKKLPGFLKLVAAKLLWPSIRYAHGQFSEFIESNISVSERSYSSEEDLLENPPVSDVYCTGGDQMWNEQHNGHKTFRPFYLAFAPTTIPRVSFSTSLGKELFADWELPDVIPLLKRYTLISVREKSAKDYLSSLGIKNVFHIIDPTLLLEKQEWEKIAAPKIIKKNYILIYEMSRRSPLAKAARVLANETGKKLVRINYYQFDSLKNGKSILCPKPEEFLSLFLYADFIITNSFHGVAFSIALQKQFAVILGANCVRLKNMLESTHLENKICMDPETISNLYQEEIDYTTVTPFLKQARAECDAYIEKIKALVPQE